MRFSVVIPTYNNLPELQDCLRALDALEEQDFEVLVGIDGSTDGTEEWLQSAHYHFPLRVLTHPGKRNEGRAATRNLALPHVRGEFTLFLDSDMEATPDLFRAHLAVLEQSDTVSIGTVRYRNQKDNLWVRYTAGRGVGKYPHHAEVPFNYFITANSALPTRFFKGCDGFDAKIRHYGGEDMELGYRIHLKYQPRHLHNTDAVVETTQPKTLDEALVQLREYGGTGLPYITRKWPDLAGTYWVDRIGGGGLKNALFNGLTRPGFRGIARALLRISPFAVQKLLINYLVISYVHEGYRKARG